MKAPALLSILALAALPIHADETLTRLVKFEKGKNSTVIEGKVSGRDSVVYKLNARDKQFLQVTLIPDKESADFNVYIPGKGPGDEALFASAMADKRKYLGQLYKTGDHSISVFLNRNAARRGITANYKLQISITDEKPVEKEEVPATGPVPRKVINDCLAALRKQVGQEAGMKVISAKRGETSFIVDVRVSGAEKPWRCYHDGSKCTGTEYQGKG
ncbi:MAG: hypothetical protein P1U90_21240 [Akkermansiaceae bacterium]|jgi:hypothetical protein|nr:hypothetical protein [Akkermansiaceae bacterium]